MVKPDVNIWNEQYPIRFYHVRGDKTVCPSLLCDFMQDSAVNHIEALGHSLEMLHEQNHGWVLSKMFLELNSLPKWKDQVRIQTWQPGIEKMYALRDYILSNESEEEIGRATSFWLAVDMENKKLLKPQTYLHDDVFRKNHRAILKEPRKISSVSGVDHKMDFIVHENNLDLNGHTNSITYLKWIVKVLKELIDPEYRMSALEINYNGQSFLEDTIYLHSNIQKSEDPQVLISNHTLINEKSGDVICNATIEHKK